MIVPIEVILNMPLGKCLSGDNWESYVYELGNDWVYKEIKTEHDLDRNTDHFNERYTLQRFWCSDTHFRNTVCDHEVMAAALGEWIPRTYILQAPARFSDNPRATITVQQRAFGTLLSDLPDHLSDSLDRLTEAVAVMANEHFHAPLDFHPGNIMINETNGKVSLYDTGTPSDWQYFLDVSKLKESIDISDEDAERFVRFMTPTYEKHRVKSGMTS